MTCYTNDSDPQRCLVRLFQTYVRHRPHDNPNFYLTPLRKPKGDIWYSNVPVGHNTLSRTVARLCKSAGIPGYKTNHSLRVTCATRLFQNGVDEQLIMGHCSVDGVRSYKRISDEQRKAVSNVLHTTGENKENLDEGPSAKKSKLDLVPCNPGPITQPNLPPPTCVSDSTTTLSLTKCSSCTPSFNFSGCSSITINNYHMS